MELILLIAGLILLDILAMRFGVDSRNLNVRDGRAWWPEPMNCDAWHDAALARQARFHHEANMQHLASAASAARLTAPRPSLRLRSRLAYGVRALAVRIDPSAPAGARIASAT